MMNIPVIPMIRILKQFAASKNIPLDARRWESIVRCFNIYQSDAQFKN